MVGQDDLRVIIGRIQDIFDWRFWLEVRVLVHRDVTIRALGLVLELSHLLGKQSVLLLIKLQRIYKLLTFLIDRLPVHALRVLEESVLALCHRLRHLRTELRFKLMNTSPDLPLFPRVAMTRNIRIILRAKVLRRKKGRIIYRLRLISSRQLRIVLVRHSIKLISPLRNGGGYFRPVLIKILLVLLL